MARVATEAAPGSLMSEFDGHQMDDASYSNGGFKLSASSARSPWEHNTYTSSNEPDSPPIDNVIGWVIRGSTPPTTVQKDKKLCCCTKLGRRKRQEDRLVVCPQIKERDDMGFYGVFDGTVGDDAAHFAQSYLLKELMKTEDFENVLDMSHVEFESSKARSAIRRSLEQAYKETDANLLEHCAKHRLDYASSTSVTALITDKLMTVGSLGDSRIAIGRERKGSLVGEFLTKDHKPDQPEELRRIQSTGGTLTYLHGGKPFLRGGDFARRQQRGDRPMQLNYSRAFGGKDLKCFGLSATPDITQLTLGESDHLVILASDGLWDVVDADTAVRMAWHAYINGRDASEDLTDFALKQHDYRGSIDNVTVVVLFTQH